MPLWFRSQAQTLLSEKQVITALQEQAIIWRRDGSSSDAELLVALVQPTPIVLDVPAGGDLLPVVFRPGAEVLAEETNVLSWL